jgi:hypothetical protein
MFLVVEVKTGHDRIQARSIVAGTLGLSAAVPEYEPATVSVDMSMLFISKAHNATSQFPPQILNVLLLCTVMLTYNIR